MNNDQNNDESPLKNVTNGREDQSMGDQPTVTGAIQREDTFLDNELTFGNPGDILGGTSKRLYH